MSEVEIVTEAQAILEVAKSLKDIAKSILVLGVAAIVAYAFKGS